MVQGGTAFALPYSASAIQATSNVSAAGVISPNSTGCVNGSVENREWHASTAIARQSADSHLNVGVFLLAAQPMAWAWTESFLRNW